MNNMARTFVKNVEKAGYEGSVYSSKNYLKRIWNVDLFENIWLALYSSTNSYDGDIYLWQICNTGTIEGINGDVDIDVLYK